MLTQHVKTVLSGTLSLVILMGIARFGYTSFLPEMQTVYGLSDSFSGILAAINYAGYLIGAVCSIKISSGVTRYKLFRVCLVLGVVTTPIMALGDIPVLMILSRLLAGFATAGGMLIASGLILNWLIRHGHRPEMGWHFAGVGVGIAGLAFFTHYVTGWLMISAQWYWVSFAAAILAIPVWLWMPKPGSNQHPEMEEKPVTDSPPDRAFIWHIFPAYFCAGYGYVVSATFIVAQVERIPELAGQGQIAFMAIGLGGAPATVLWDRINRKLGDGYTMVLAFVMQAVAIIMPLLIVGEIPMMIGAVAFGFSFMGLVSLVLSLAGRFYPSNPAKLMGKLTLCYGSAQIVGPFVTGLLADFGLGLNGGLVLAFIIQMIGALIVIKLVYRGQLNIPR